MKYVKICECGNRMVITLEGAKFSFNSETVSFSCDKCKKINDLRLI